MSESGLHAFARKYASVPCVGGWGDFASGLLNAALSAVDAGIKEDQKEKQEKKVAEDVLEAVKEKTAAAEALL